MGRIVFDYLWITVLIAVIFAALGYFFPDLGGSGSGAVTSVIAAMVTGQLYGQRTGEEVSSGFAWKVAAMLTVVSTLFGLVVLFGAQFAGLPLLPDDLEVDFGVFGMILGLFAFLIFLVTRFTFRWGVKTGAKAVAAKKSKAEIFD